jgi:hypothetical protein
MLECLNIFLSFDVWKFDDENFRWLEGRKSNNNNIKIPSPSSILTIVIIMIDFHPAGSSSGRFDFFSSPFFRWKSLALLAFLFSFLTDNNFHNPHFYHHYHHHLPLFHFHCQLKATALHSRRGDWPSQ